MSKKAKKPAPTTPEERDAVRAKMKELGRFTTHDLMAACAGIIDKSRDRKWFSDRVWQAVGLGHVQISKTDRGVYHWRQ